MARNDLYKMMGLKVLVRCLKLIGTFHQLTYTQNFRKQVSKMQIEIYHAFNFFSKFLFIDFSLLVFIEDQSHRYSTGGRVIPCGEMMMAEAAGHGWAASPRHTSDGRKRG